MALSTGFVGLTVYNGATNALRTAQLIALIPNPDLAPANAKVPSFLDQMDPNCCAQLRLELANLMAANVG